MTPEAIRIISQIRGEFYSGFAAAMNMSVSITTSHPSTGNPPIAFWIDDRQQFNYLRVYAYKAPDELLPERPFILRLSVNKGGGIATAAKWRRGCRGLNQGWYFELTLLPEEVMDFLPWLVSFVKHQQSDCASFLPEPPHPFHFTTTKLSSLKEAWTQKAWQESKPSHVPIDLELNKLMPTAKSL